MNKNLRYLIFISVISFLGTTGQAQNIAVNTTGAAAAAANLFEVTQPAGAANNSVGIFASHLGTGTNAYAIWAQATGATNKYAIVVPWNSGYVGIGTTTPQRWLHIVSGPEGAVPSFPTAAVGARDAVVLENNSNVNMSFVAGSGALSRIRFMKSGDAANDGWMEYVHSPTVPGDYMDFATATLERMRIDNAGNVGIGTTSPNQLLHVYNGTVARQLIGTGTTLTEPYTGFLAQNISALQIVSSNTIGGGVYLGWTGTANGDYTGSLQFMTTGTSSTEKRSAYIASTLLAASGSAVTGGLVFGTNNNGTLGEKMRIDNAGNVGIGTTAPGAKLSFQDLNNGVNTADGITWYNPAPTAYGIFRTAGAWSAPDYQQLRLQWATGIILDPGSAYGKSFVDIEGRVKIVDGSQGAGKVLLSDAAGLASWSTMAGAGAVTGTCGSGANYVPKMSSASAITCSQIYDNGTNVGIGTASPGVKLDVVGGNIRAQGGSIYTTYPTGYSQTELEQWGLYNPSTMYIENGPGSTLYLTDQWSYTGSLDARYGNYLFQYGKTTMSKSGTGECCSGGAFTLAIAENTSVSGNKASIQFHNSGQDEGQIQLAGSADPTSIGGVAQRRFKMLDWQGVTTGLQITGKLFYGTSDSRTEDRPDAGLYGGTGAQSGFYQTSAPSPWNDWPTDGANASANFDASGHATNWWHMVDVRHSNPGNNYALQLAGGFFDQNLYFRKTNNSATQAWSKVLTNGNVNTYIANASRTTINSSSYVDITGLSITITVNCNTFFMINTSGAVETQSGSFNGGSGSREALVVTGTVNATLQEQTTDLLNNSNYVQVCEHWGISHAVVYGPGTYTFKMQALNYVGSGIYAGGSLTSLPNEGQMVIMTWPQ